MHPREEEMGQNTEPHSRSGLHRELALGLPPPLAKHPVTRMAPPGWVQAESWTTGLWDGGPLPEVPPGWWGLFSLGVTDWGRITGPDMQTEESLTHRGEHWRPCQCRGQPPASCARYQNCPGLPPEAWSRFPTSQQRHQIPGRFVKKKKKSPSKLKVKPMWGEFVL